MWIAYWFVEPVKGNTMGVKLKMSGRTFYLTPTDARKLAYQLNDAAAEVALAMTEVGKEE